MLGTVEGVSGLLSAFTRQVIVDMLLGGQLKTGNFWTGQNRQLTDGGRNQ